MIKEFNNLEEIQKYYDEKTNTYIFKENEEYIDLIKFNFDLNIPSNIEARDIIAGNINAYNINAHNISAFDINACDINVWFINALDIYAHYFNADNINACDIKAFDINACDIIARDINALDIIARDINSCSIVADNIIYSTVCFAYESIKCKSIKGRRTNSKHFVLNGEIEIRKC